MKTKSVQVPKQTWEDLKILAFEKRTFIKYIVEELVKREMERRKYINE